MIKIEFQLTSADFLQHQLYTASQSDLVKKKRRNLRLVVPILYLMVAFYFFSTERDTMALVFALTGVLWFIFHPIYSRSRYKNHYIKYIAEQFKNRVNKNIMLSIDDDFIYLKDDANETKISTKGITNIVELKDHFLIRMKTGVAILVPKNKTPELEFKQHFRKLNVDIKDEINWKWR